MTDYSPAIIIFIICFGFLIAMKLRKNLFFYVFIVVAAIANGTILAGMTGLFYLPVVAGISGLFSMALYFIFRPVFPEGHLEKKDIILISLILIVCLSFQYKTQYLGGQDAVSGFLPISRHLSERHGFPEQKENISEPDSALFRLGAPPLILGFGGLLFQLTGMASEKVASFVPVFFFMLFLLITFLWAKEKEIDVLWIGILVLFSYFIVRIFSWFCQEGPLAFFSAVVFYTLYKFIKTKEISFFKVALLASGLSGLTKITGLELSFLIILFGLFYRLWNTKTVGLFIFAHLVPILWFLRNYLLFGAFYSSGAGQDFVGLNPEIDASAMIQRLLHLFESFPYEKIAKAYFLVPIFAIWLILAPLRWKRMEQFERLVWLCYAGTVFVWVWFLGNLTERYLIFFAAPCLIFLGVLAKEINEHNLMKVKNKIGYLSIGLLTAGTLVLNYSIKGETGWFPEFYNNREIHLRAIDFLKTEEKVAPDTKILADTDMGFRWFGRLYMLEAGYNIPRDEFKLALREGEIASLFKKYGVRYVIDEWLITRLDEKIFPIVESDKKNFTSIYKRDGITIWRVNYLY